MTKGTNFQGGQGSLHTFAIELTQDKLVVLFVFLPRPGIVHRLGRVEWDSKFDQEDFILSHDHQVWTSRSCSDILRNGCWWIVTHPVAWEVGIQGVTLSQEGKDTTDELQQNTVMTPGQSALVQGSWAGIRVWRTVGNKDLVVCLSVPF